MGEPWSQSAWAAVVGEAHTLERTQAPDPRRPGRSTGQEGKGYHPKLTFPVGLSSWQPLHPTVCTEPARGAGPPPRLPFCTTPSGTVWLNWGALWAQREPLLSRLVL